MYIIQYKNLSFLLSSVIWGANPFRIGSQSFIYLPSSFSKQQSVGTVKQNKFNELKMKRSTIGLCWY